MANKSEAKNNKGSKGGPKKAIDAAQEGRAAKSEAQAECRYHLINKFFAIPAGSGLSKEAKAVYDEERRRMTHRLKIVYAKGLDDSKLPDVSKAD